MDSSASLGLLLLSLPCTFPYQNGNCTLLLLLLYLVCPWEMVAAPQDSRDSRALLTILLYPDLALPLEPRGSSLSLCSLGSRGESWGNVAALMALLQCQGCTFSFCQSQTSVCTEVLQLLYPPLAFYSAFSFSTFSGQSPPLPPVFCFPSESMSHSSCPTEISRSSGLNQMASPENKAFPGTEAPTTPSLCEILPLLQPFLGTGTTR